MNHPSNAKLFGIDPPVQEEDVTKAIILDAVNVQMGHCKAGQCRFSKKKWEINPLMALTRVFPSPPFITSKGEIRGYVLTFRLFTDPTERTNINILCRL